MPDAGRRLRQEVGERYFRVLAAQQRAGLDESRQQGLDDQCGAVGLVQEVGQQLPLCSGIQWHGHESAARRAEDGQQLLEDMRHHKLISLSTMFFMVTAEGNFSKVISAAELIDGVIKLSAGKKKIVLVKPV